MDQVSDRLNGEEHIEQIVAALTNGTIFVDAAGRVVWMDDGTRRTVNGGLHDLVLPIRKSDRPSLDCFLSTAEIALGGQRKTLCVIQEAGGSANGAGLDLVAAIESVMADTSWFTRAIVEKLKALRPPTRPLARSSDLDLLTDREREILAFICEGRSDADMSRTLGLSQNTVRNHVASLYRKIGVNRRSAAVIWARERAISSEEVLSLRPKRRYREDGAQDRPKK